MAATEVVGARDMLQLAPLRVGRVDSRDGAPNPAGMLLPGEASVKDMAAYWTARRLSVEDGVALLGAHALMEGKGCAQQQQRSGRAVRAAAAATATVDAAPDDGSGAVRKLQLTCVFVLAGGGEHTKKCLYCV